MDAHQERRAKNENLFREVNERIEHLDAPATGRSEFVCECDDLECSQRFEMKVGEYERLRSDPTTFAVVPGHNSPDVEAVIEKAAGYWVVEKYAGGPARLATEDAPRQR